MLVPDLLEEGILLFNTGKFFEAHEVWEDLWRETPDSPLKACYQGLIQAAVGLHHLTRRNLAGARSQLAKSIRNLQSGASITTGLDIENLVVQLQKLEGSLSDTRIQGVRIARLK